MSFDPVEGTDYIFDRYAYLGLEMGADKKDIKKLISRKRGAVHPDRLRRASKGILQQADAERRLINKCAEILLDDEFRPLYDERLKEFNEHSPQLVSTNGQAIIDLSKDRFVIDSLLNEELPDTAFLEQKLQELTQFSF